MNAVTHYSKKIKFTAIGAWMATLLLALLGLGLLKKTLVFLLLKLYDLLIELNPFRA